MGLADADKDGRISLEARFPTCATSLTYNCFGKRPTLGSEFTSWPVYVLSICEEVFFWVKTASLVQLITPVGAIGRSWML